MTLWLFGYPDQAFARMERASQMAREIRHAEILAWTLLAKCEVNKARRDTGQVRAAAEELLSICEINGLVMQPALA
jgi:hypothetical protein